MLIKLVNKRSQRIEQITRIGSHLKSLWYTWFIISLVPSLVFFFFDLLSILFDKRFEVSRFNYGRKLPKRAHFCIYAFYKGQLNCEHNHWISPSENRNPCLDLQVPRSIAGFVRRLGKFFSNNFILSGVVTLSSLLFLFVKDTKLRSIQVRKLRAFFITQVARSASFDLLLFRLIFPSAVRDREFQHVNSLRIDLTLRITGKHLLQNSNFNS